MGLVLVYAGIFLFQVATQPKGIAGLQQGPLAELCELQAAKVLQGEIWRLATYSFISNPHDIWAVAINIVFLLWFGRQMEDIYGWREFLGFYLIAGVIAGIGFVVMAALTDHRETLIGPAGSVTAVLLLFALHYPRRTILLFLVVPCPVWVLVAFYVLSDVAGFFGGQLHPAAFAAHALAAAFGFVYYQLSLRITHWLPSLPARSAPAKARPKLQIFHEEADETQPAPAASNRPVSAAGGPARAPAASSASISLLDEHLEAKLDEVLEKVKKHGQSSLSEEERSILFRASELYRKRRKSGGN